jgi:hypothetical protein
VKTDQWVALLATGTEAVDKVLPVRRLLFAALAGAAIATLLTSALLGLRPTLLRDVSVPMFWVKETFCVMLGAGGLVAVVRLGRPGSRIGWVWTPAAAAIAALWLLAAPAG